MLEVITDIRHIKNVHYGIVNVLHIVRHAPVCVACAKAAFRDGEPVRCGEFAEGDPIECACGTLIHSTYGPVG